MEQPAKRFYRSRTDRVIAGLSGGIGHYFSLDPVIFRLLFIILCMADGLGLLLYLIMWILVPLEPIEEGSKQEFSPVSESNSDSNKEPWGSNFVKQWRLLLGILMIVFGCTFLLMSFSDINLFVFWPLLIVGMGIWMLLSKR